MAFGFSANFSIRQVVTTICSESSSELSFSRSPLLDLFFISLVAAGAVVDDGVGTADTAAATVLPSV